MESSTLRRCGALLVALAVTLAVTACKLGGSGSNGGSGNTIPAPPTADPSYFQIMFDNQLNGYPASQVHLLIEAKDLTLQNPVAPQVNDGNGTWLTGGGVSNTDWTQPVFQIAGTNQALVGVGNFSSTYFDVTLDKLPTYNSGGTNYPVLKIPYLKPGDSTHTLGGSGRVYIILGSPGWAQINFDGTYYRIAQISPDPKSGAGGGGNLNFDYIEFNLANNDTAAPYDCYFDTTNVDFFNLGLTFIGRSHNNNTTNLGFNISANTVTSCRNALAKIISTYPNSDYSNASLNVPGGLRFLSANKGFDIWNSDYGANATCLDTAIQATYDNYQTQQTITYNNTQYVIVSDGSTLTVTGGGGTFTVAKPSTQKVLDGTLTVTLTSGSGDTGVIQAFVSAYLTRGVFTNSQVWNTPSAWYPAPPTVNGSLTQFNYDLYSATLHPFFINGQTYGFPYDDVPSGGALTAPCVSQCTSVTLELSNQ